MSILHLLPPCALSTPLFEALEGAVCTEQLVPRPCVPGRPLFGGWKRGEMCSLVSSCSPQAPRPNEEVCQLLLLSCHISSLKPDPGPLPGRAKGPASRHPPSAELSQDPKPAGSRTALCSLSPARIFCFKKLGNSSTLVFRNRLSLSRFSGPRTGPGRRRGAQNTLDRDQFTGM